MVPGFGVPAFVCFLCFSLKAFKDWLIASACRLVVFAFVQPGLMLQLSSQHLSTLLMTFRLFSASRHAVAGGVWAIGIGGFPAADVTASAPARKRMYFKVSIHTQLDCTGRDRTMYHSSKFIWTYHGLLCPAFHQQSGAAARQLAQMEARASRRC